MLWKQLEDESTVMSLSCDSLLERATQLDQSFCAFSVPLIHFNNKKKNKFENTEMLHFREKCPEF